MDGRNQVRGDLKGFRIVGRGQQFIREAANLSFELPHWLFRLRNKVVVDHVEGDGNGLTKLRFGNLKVA